MSLDNEGAGLPQEVETGESLRVNEEHKEQNANPSTLPDKNVLQPPSTLLDLSGSSEDVEKSSETSTSSSDSDYRSNDSEVDAKKLIAPAEAPISSPTAPEPRPTELKLPLQNLHANPVQNDEAEVCCETPITPKVVLELKDTSSELCSAPDSPPRTPSPSSADSLPLTSASEAESTLEHEASPMPETSSSSPRTSIVSDVAPSSLINDLASHLDVTDSEIHTPSSTEETPISSESADPSSAPEATPKVLIEICDTPPATEPHHAPAAAHTSTSDEEAVKAVLEGTTPAPETATALELTLTVPSNDSSSDHTRLQSTSSSAPADVAPIAGSSETLESDENRKSSNVAQSSSAPDLRSSNIDRSAANPDDKPAVRLSQPALPETSHKIHGKHFTPFSFFFKAF